jgi:hypothetical protein
MIKKQSRLLFKKKLQQRDISLPVVAATSPAFLMP